MGYDTVVLVSFRCPSSLTKLLFIFLECKLKCVKFKLTFINFINTILDRIIKKKQLLTFLGDICANNMMPFGWMSIVWMLFRQQLMVMPESVMLSPIQGMEAKSSEGIWAIDFQSWHFVVWCIVKRTKVMALSSKNFEPPKIIYIPFDWRSICSIYLIYLKYSGVLFPMVISQPMPLLIFSPTLCLSLC